MQNGKILSFDVDLAVVCSLFFGCALCVFPRKFSKHTTYMVHRDQKINK